MMLFFVIAQIDNDLAIVDCDMASNHLLHSFNTRKWKALYPDSTLEIFQIDEDDILKLIKEAYRLNLTSTK